MLAKAVSRLLPKRTLRTALSPLGAEERAAIDAGLRLLTQADPPPVHSKEKTARSTPRWSLGSGCGGRWGFTSKTRVATAVPNSEYSFRDTCPTFRLGGVCLFDTPNLKLPHSQS